MLGRPGTCTHLGVLPVGVSPAGQKALNEVHVPSQRGVRERDRAPLRPEDKDRGGCISNEGLCVHEAGIYCHNQGPGWLLCTVGFSFVFLTGSPRWMSAPLSSRAFVASTLP